MYQFYGKVYKSLLKPLFFSIDPDTMHDKMIGFGKVLGKYGFTKTITAALFDYENARLEQHVAGIRFKSPIGLSAGFDKNADLMEILPFVSFGYQQIGSVTLKPYKGNPKPWVVRLPESRSLIVNYGLKNIGVTKIIKSIKEADIPKDFPISISIAKTNSKATSTDAKGVADYVACFEKLTKANVGNFYTINISCPNTFGGEPFTTSARLEKLLSRLMAIQSDKPIFLKMPINLPWSDFDKLLKVAIKYKITGVVIGNLNKDRTRPEIKEPISNDVKGSLSGPSTKELSNDLISRTYKKYGKKLVIIGVGGVESADDAYEKIRLGATLVQLITGMIYEGPQLVAQINKGLVERLERDNYKSISEAVGTKINAK